MIFRSGTKGDEDDRLMNRHREISGEHLGLLLATIICKISSPNIHFLNLLVSMSSFGQPIDTQGGGETKSAPREPKQDPPKNISFNLSR